MSFFSLLMLSGWKSPKIAYFGDFNTDNITSEKNDIAYPVETFARFFKILNFLQKKYIFFKKRPQNGEKIISDLKICRKWLKTENLT